MSQTMSFISSIKISCEAIFHPRLRPLSPNSLVHQCRHILQAFQRCYRFRSSVGLFAFVDGDGYSTAPDEATEESP